MVSASKPESRRAISAVLPVRNAQASLEAAILDATAVLDGLVGAAFEIVVVDDGSTDGTSERLHELALRRPSLPMRVVRHEQPRGLATAMASGFDAARLDLVFCMTPDGQFDLAELNRLVDNLDDDTDVVIGYRAQRADGLVRRLSSWGWNQLVNTLFGWTARDVDCGFKLLRREVWQAVQASSRSPVFSTELVVKARRCGFQVREVPIHQLRRGAGEPSIFGPALLELVQLRRSLDAMPCAAGEPVSVKRRAA